MRDLVISGLMIGLQPDAIRDMVPKDTWDTFGKWADAHKPDKPGSGAMGAEEYRELVRRVDGI